jgi:hypothetical protein
MREVNARVRVKRTNQNPPVMLHNNNHVLNSGCNNSLKTQLSFLFSYSYASTIAIAQSTTQTPKIKEQVYATN